MTTTTGDLGAAPRASWNEDARGGGRRGERGGGRGIGGSRATVWSYRSPINLVSSRNGPSAVCCCLCLLCRALLLALGVMDGEDGEEWFANGAAIPVPPTPPCTAPNMILSGNLECPKCPIFNTVQRSCATSRSWFGERKNPDLLLRCHSVV